MALVAIWLATYSAQAFAAPLPPPLDRLEAEAPPMRLSVNGSNGHRISFEGAGTRVTATVEGEDGTAIYSTRGRAADGRLRARFGGLGRIAVRFQPLGEPSRQEPPKGCRGEPAVTRRGVFRGTIRFRGEGGYTRVARQRARGATTTSPRRRCRGGQEDAGAPQAAAEEALGAAVLGAFAPAGRVVFAAIGEGDPAGLGSAIFLAGTEGRLGPVRVERFTAAIGGPGSFGFDSGLATATVSPPPPFGGSAGFRRDADGAVDWSGSLAVSLPGAPDLALTGPSFSADLARPRTAEELFALLGRPDMTGR